MLTFIKKIFKKKNLHCAWTMQGRKPSQEDNYLISKKQKDRQLFFVADGVGGHVHGDFASQLCVDIFKNAFENETNFANISDFLRKTALLVASTVLNKSSENPEYKNCGTTISGFFIENDTYTTINIGDSRVYSFYNNRLERKTKDHSEVQRLLDLEYITEEQAFNHPQRNMMTSAIGQPLEIMDIEIKGPYPIETDEYLMAFSDGVHDALKDEEIINIINKFENSENLAKEIVENAYEAGSKDNITACIYKHK